ncbi:MAG: PHP domain-containing protein [Candidatus Hodarchaeales archaeon]
MKRHDLHVHSIFSDGKLSPAEIVDLAENKGLQTIGICDHAFSGKLPANMQVTSRLDEYLENLRLIQANKQVVTVKVGLEIDVSKNYGIDPAKIPCDVINSYDYVLFEYVNTEHEHWGRVGSRDIKEIVKIRDKIDIPVGLAHNDMSRNYHGRESDICYILSSNDIFIELQQSERNEITGKGRNTREGKDYYQHFSFKLIKEMVDNKVTVITGTDSHGGKSIGNIDEVIAFIEKYGLEINNVIR